MDSDRDGVNLVTCGGVQFARETSRAGAENNTAQGVPAAPFPGKISNTGLCSYSSNMRFLCAGFFTILITGTCKKGHSSPQALRLIYSQDSSLLELVAVF